MMNRESSVHRPLLELLLDDSADSLAYVLRLCSDGNQERREQVLRALLTVFRFYSVAGRKIRQIVTHYSSLMGQSLGELPAGCTVIK